MPAINPSTLRYLGDFGLLITALLWGGAFVAQRSAMAHVEPFTFNGLRFLLGAITVLLLLRSKILKNINWAVIFSGSALGIILFIGGALQQTALVTTSAGITGFITGLYVVIIPLLLRLIWRKRVNSAIWIAIALSTTGLLLLSFKERFSLQTGDIWALLSAVVFAVHIIFAEVFVKDHQPLLLSFLQNTVSGVLSLFVAFLFEDVRWETITAVRHEALYAGIISCGIAYSLQIVCQKWTPSAHAAIILSLEAVFAAIAGWWLLGERLTGLELLGCLLMFVAVIIVPLVQSRGEKNVRTERRRTEL